MNKTITDEHEQLLKDVCTEVVDDPMQSNVVKVSRLAEDERIIEGLDVDGVNHVVGKILANAEWAQKWSRGRYAIDDS